jgi:hypothetical protein
VLQAKNPGRFGAQSPLASPPIQYFQEPWVAEAELGADVEATLLRVTFSMSGDGTGRVVAGILPAGSGFLDGTVEPDSLPPWINAEDLREIADDFRRTGFAGGLNWYRAIRKTYELMAACRGCPIHQPSLFIAGDRDDVLKFPGMKARIDSLSEDAALESVSPTKPKSRQRLFSL